MGRLLFDILFERKLVKKLMDAGMRKEVDFVIRKHFSGHTLKDMSLITNVVNHLELLDKASVDSRSKPADDYPLFCQEESKEVLEHYNVACLEKGHLEEVQIFEELPATHVVVYALKKKRKTLTSGEGPSESVRTPTKVARTSRLSILKDTMGPEAETIRSETARSFEVTPLEIMVSRL